MKNKKISLFYEINKKQIIPPKPEILERKEEWIKEVQQELPEKGRCVVRLTYEIYNAEIKRQLAFFNGPVMQYYVIQSTDSLDTLPERAEIARWREQLLDDSLGYDLPLINRTVRRRKSTADFKTTQKWHDFLERLREDHFEAQGYEFPVSDEFLEMESKHGTEKAQAIMISQLQDRLRRKLSTVE